MPNRSCTPSPARPIAPARPLSLRDVFFEKSNILERVFAAATSGERYHLKGTFSITILTMIKALLMMQS